MKKLVLLIAVFGFFAYSLSSCGGKQEKTENADEYGEYEIAEPEDAAPQEEASIEDLIKQGQALSEASDCKTCHHQTNKLIGPAHVEVAKKYEFTEPNVKLLAAKIIEGGSGVWGEIPMTPHVGLSEDDARKMAIYVLSLDGEEPKLD